MKPEVALLKYFCMPVNRHVHMYQLKEWRVSGNERQVVTQKELTLQASGRWDSEEWPWIQAGTRNLTGRSVSSVQAHGSAVSACLLHAIVSSWQHLSLCSVGCTWPHLHPMAFFQVQFPLLTASFRRMRSSPQCQELKVLYSYRLAQLISGTSQATSYRQAALGFSRQSWK